MQSEVSFSKQLEQNANAVNLEVRRKSYFRGEVVKG